MKTMKKMYRFFICLLLCLMMVTQLAAPAFAATDAVKNAKNGVVRVLVTVDVDVYVESDGSYYYYTSGTAYGRGSGFGVGTVGEETDVFVTNRHVVEDWETEYATVNGVSYAYVYTITGYYILLDDYAYNISTYTLDTSRSVPCSVIYMGESDDADVAILRAAEPVSGRVALALQDDESSLEVSDSVWTIGYPATSDSATNENYLLGAVDSSTTTEGSVSRFYETTSVTTSGGLLSGRVIQISAPINAGNSGGPLVDENGTVVGINTYTFSSSDSSVTSAYYALRIKYAKDALDDLGIDYDVYKPTNYVPIIIGAVVVVLLIVAAVVILLITRGKKKPKASTNPAPQPVGPQFDAMPNPLDAMPNPPIQQETQPLVPDSGFRIQGATGQFVGKRFAISGTVKIGRDSTQCQIVYPAATQGISRVHCELFVSAGKLYLRDLNSAYGTFLQNGQRLASNQAVELLPGQQFYLASPQETFQIGRRGGV